MGANPLFDTENGEPPWHSSAGAVQSHRGHTLIQQDLLLLLLVAFINQCLLLCNIGRTKLDLFISVPPGEM